MNSELFKLNQNDFIKGAINAVFGGVAVAIGAVVLSSGFDVFQADWVAIAKIAVNAGLGAFAGYLSKNFLSDSQGRVLGRIG